jgi:hypothetical protein
MLHFFSGIFDTNYIYIIWDKGTNVHFYVVFT